MESHLLTTGSDGGSVDEAARQAFDADEDTLVLVRPDQNIALTTTMANRGVVTAYLDRLSR